MALLTLVTANDLALWAGRRDAQERFPLLVRRLIQASPGHVTRLHFRSGEGVQLPGWDGIVTMQEGDAYVPTGPSAWELGVGVDPGTKANEDYAKRLADQAGVNPADTAFVFATPRRWAGKERWAAQRRAEGRWSDVRALDADDIEAWLQTAPAVHVWLSILLGKHPLGVSDLGTFWEAWALATRPPLSPDLVLAGREKVAQDVVGFAAGQAGALALKCDSRQEAVAVLAAAVSKLPTEDGDPLKARCVVVAQESAWEQLISSATSLLLVPLCDLASGTAPAVRRGHSVLIPLGAADPPGAAVAEVPRLSRHAARDALVAMGIVEDRAWELAGLARRSMTALRRSLACSPDVRTPVWARPEHVRDLVPLLLAGGWNMQKEGDQLVVSELALEPHEAVAEKMLRWSQTDDPPVRRSADVWFAASRDDLWRLAAQCLTAQDMERLRRALNRVLGEPDPRFDLEDERRWMAGVLGHESPYSGVLIEGLADTLAIMGALGERVFPSVGASACDTASLYVRELLARANQDWRIWASLSGVLPRLAEAAPDVFLEAVDTGCSGEAPVLRSLFSDQSDALFSSSPHTGLLWSLEVLGWHPDYLAPAALALARLAALDPGGKLTNRPSNSLREIFLGWHPQTMATLAQRIEVVDLIRREEPVVAWALLSALLPEHHGVAMNTPFPRWREWIPDSRPTATVRDFRMLVEQVVDRMVLDADQDGERWQRLVEALEVLAPGQQEAIVAQLDALEGQLDAAIDRQRVWTALRELVARHRTYQEADWALPPERVDALNALLGRYAPGDPVVRFAWLFTHGPDLPTGGPAGDHREHEIAVAKERALAVQAVYGQRGLLGVRDLAKEAKEPFFVGLAVGEMELADNDVTRILTEDLGSAELPCAQFSSAFVSSRFMREGWDWVRDNLAKRGGEWSAERRAAFLVALPHGPQTWSLATDCGRETETSYWRSRGPYGLEEHSTCTAAAQKYLEHGRPVNALDVLAVYRNEAPDGLPPALVLDVLEGTIAQLAEGGTASQMFAHHVAELVDVLENAQAIDRTRLARIEWTFLPLLGRHDRKPRLLHRELAGNAVFFIEVLSLLYRAEDEERRELTPEEYGRWQVAHELLESWHSVPGCESDGPVDPIGLARWVGEARSLAAAAGRSAAADQHIGKVLSHVPAGPGGEWPHPAVCEIIEQLGSPDAEQGFQVAVFNSRGVVWKDPAGGGNDERASAERYERLAAAISTRSPRTAAMLRRMSASHRRDAAREDANAELREDLGR